MGIMPSRYRYHSTEFKLRLIQAVLSGEGSRETIARQHKISPYLLQSWIEKYRRGELSEDQERKERIREYEVKIAALERKVGQLTMEVDLLKKLQQGVRKKNDKPSVVSGPSAVPSRKDAAS
jgi:transposase